MFPNKHVSTHFLFRYIALTAKRCKSDDKDSENDYMFWLLRWDMSCLQCNQAGSTTKQNDYMFRSFCQDLRRDV